MPARRAGRGLVGGRAVARQAQRRDAAGIDDALDAGLVGPPPSAAPCRRHWRHTWRRDRAPTADNPPPHGRARRSPRPPPPATASPRGCRCGSRHRARRGCGGRWSGAAARARAAPAARSARATAEPTKPDAPVTSTGLSAAAMAAVRGADGARRQTAWAPVADDAARQPRAPRRRRRRRRRAGRDAVPATASSVRSTVVGDVEKADAAIEKGGDRDLVGGVEHGRRAAAALERGARQPQRRETLRIGRLEGQPRQRWPDRGAGSARRCARASRARWRSACACRASRAAPAPSRRCNRRDRARPTADGRRYRAARSPRAKR